MLQFIFNSVSFVIRLAIHLFTLLQVYFQYAPQLKRNLIFVGILKMLGLVISVRDGIFKMTKGSMVVMKGVRRNNLYYLKGSTVTSQVETSISSNNVCTQVW